MSKSDPTDVERYEHATWEASADVYAEAVGFMTALSGQPEIAVEEGGIDSRSRGLDVGCGPGMLSAALAKCAGQVDGIDFFARPLIAEVGRRVERGVTR